MNTHEMPNARQAYEHPWTESVWLHVESVICYSPGSGIPNTEEEDNP